MEMAVFVLFAALALVSALVVVTHRNPVYSTMSLVVTLVSLAALFVLLGAPFIAVLQVLIYTGAILVLFLFVIMLLNIGREETGASSWLTKVPALAAAVIFGAMVAVFSWRAFRDDALAPLTPEFVSLRRLSRGALRPVPPALRDDRAAAPGGGDRGHRAGAARRARGGRGGAGTPARGRGGAGDGAMSVPISWYLLLAAVLFAIGAVGALTRRNGITIFLSIELMLNAVNLTLIAYSRLLERPDRPDRRLLRARGRRRRGRGRPRALHRRLPPPADDRPQPHQPDALVAAKRPCTRSISSG